MRLQSRRQLGSDVLTGTNRYASKMAYCTAGKVMLAAGGRPRCLFTWDSPRDARVSS